MLKEETELQNEVAQTAATVAMKQTQNQIIKMIQQSYGELLQKVKDTHEKCKRISTAEPV